MITGGAGVAVGVGVGVAAERSPSTIKPHAAAAKHAIAMSRLISQKKGLAVMLEELVSPDAAEHPAPREENTTFFDPLRKRRNQVPKMNTFFFSRRLKLFSRFEMVSDSDDRERIRACSSN